MTENNETSIFSRAVVVAAMWFSWGIMGANAFASGESVNPLIILLPLVIVSLFTLVIWMGPSLTSMIERMAEKPKRGSTDSMSALMELMDEDERQEFKQQLKQRMLDNVSRGSVDGELPLDSESLELLLDDDYDEKVLRS
jgi:hypothetical protein